MILNSIFEFMTSYFTFFTTINKDGNGAHAILKCMSYQNYKSINSFATRFIFDNLKQIYYSYQLGKIILAKELLLKVRNLFRWPYFAKKMCKYYQFANQWNSNALKEAKHEKSQCYQLCLIFPNFFFFAQNV